MRLLILESDSLGPPGLMADVAGSLVAAGHKVFVAAPPPAGMSAAAARARLGVTGWLALRSGACLPALIINMWGVSGWVRVLRPDLLLAGSVVAALIANVARGATGGEAFSTLVLDRLPTPTTVVDRVLATKVVRECDRLFVMQPDLREALVERGSRRADTLVAAGPDDIVALCEVLEQEKAFILPQPASRAP